MNAPRAHRRGEAGAALIIALFIVSVVSVMATAMSRHYLLTLKRHSNTLHGEQAWLYLLSAENLALHVLHTDIKQDRHDNELRDHKGEEWARGVATFPMEGGSIQVEIQDLHARLNIAGLLNTSGTQSTKSEVPYNEPQRRFIRLLQTYSVTVEGLRSPLLSEEEALDVATAVADWMDLDDDVRGPASMEDNDYLSAGMYYRAANALPKHPSELRMVHAITNVDGLLERLLPDITVWPAQGEEININTATDNVLRSLYAGPDGRSLRPLPVEDFPRLLEDQRRQVRWPSEEVGGFFNLQSLSSAPVWNGQTNIVGLIEHSKYFLFIGTVQLGDVRRQMHSVLLRDLENNSVRVLSRSLGSL